MQSTYITTIIILFLTSFQSMAATPFKFCTDSYAMVTLYQKSSKYDYVFTGYDIDRGLSYLRVDPELSPGGGVVLESHFFSYKAKVRLDDLGPAYSELAVKKAKQDARNSEIASARQAGLTLEEFRENSQLAFWGDKLYEAYQEASTDYPRLPIENSRKVAYSAKEWFEYNKQMCLELNRELPSGLKIDVRKVILENKIETLEELAEKRTREEINQVIGAVKGGTFWIEKSAICE